MDADRSKFLVELINRLTPLNNKWRSTNVAISKIEIMWSIGKEIDEAVKGSDFGYDELLRTLYDPHGKKMSYITRDLLSYSHRVYSYFGTNEEIQQKFTGLTSYTLFREAFPLLTNDKYKLTTDQKNEIISLIVGSSSTKAIQNKLIKIKQNIRPIKNTRTTKSKQYSEVAAYLTDLQKNVAGYFRSKEELDMDSFPVDKKTAETLKTMLLTIAFDKKLEGNFNTKALETEILKQIHLIANSKTEDKARFKKWGMDTYSLMTLSEMLNVLSDADKYNFVRQKVVSKL